MSLPSPLPDNPLKWPGWKAYNSDNHYERLCLDPATSPDAAQIEDHCRQLLVWWQKKLPLKNQPSNPMAQLLRGGIDEAPKYLAEARTFLLDPEKRRALDEKLRAQFKEAALEEFNKFFSFAISGGTLSEEDEAGLHGIGTASGFSPEEIKEVIESELLKRKVKRFVKPAPVAAPVSYVAGDPASEFRRVLRMSKLEEGEMSDDQRDAMCNIGESLGLTGGQAEDLIDEYIDEVNGLPPLQMAKAPVRAPVAAKPAEAKPSGVDLSAFHFSPVKRAEEKQRHPAFTNCIGSEMLLVTSGVFAMGGSGGDALPIEAPVSQVGVGCFFMSRWPVTNAQYERFDPAHASKRAPWADDHHPVIYVNCHEAAKYCEWLCSRERKKYRLPTEAEWEYAARGMDGRLFPWGDRLTGGDMANFADAQTNFVWREASIDDGFPHTSPVGSFPHGVSPFGIEDMAGNVWEWCFDFYAPYPGKDRINPRGPAKAAQRVYRGGSWKSRIGNLRASARGFALPNFSSNDVGFRLVCECD